ncbi:MAG: YicC family protein [Flavobacteriales bacterium]|nr:YicC family protein [Flavobacteriales bacterium]
MIRSMTGFGKASGEFQHKKINVEVRSLNSKQLDLSTRISGHYREKEHAYRGIAGKAIVRGKSELSIYIENNAEQPKAVINQELAQNYYQDIKNLADSINESNTSLLGQVLRMPDVMKTERSETEEGEWSIVENAIDEALHKFNSSREQEGEKLGIDFKMRLGIILNLLSEIETLEGDRMEKVKERLTTNLDSLKIEVDQNRFEQELIYYLEKYDITEEKVRLRAHCEYFIETMNEKEAQGKKLGFIGQELGREINTIGSKANHSEIQKMVVQMKDELEKIKEQVLNVL